MEKLPKPIQLEKEQRECCKIAKEAQEYKPWRKAMKNIEQNIGRLGKTLPCCPKCGEGFRLEQIDLYVNEICCENKGWVNKE